MLDKSIKFKGEDPLAKLGAMIATGILNSGGRNSQFNLTSEKTDKTIKTSVIGIVMFLQMFYWYPQIPFISLCLKPQALIILEDTLEIKQNFSLICSTKPSKYAYPQPKSEETKKKEEKKAKKDSLSIQNRINVRKAIRKEKGDISVVEKRLEEELKKKEEESAVEDEKKQDEPDFFELENPCRILYSQENYIE